MPLLNFIVTVIACLIFYLILTAGSGTEILIWSWQQFAVGILFSLVVGMVGRNVLVGKDLRMVNPRRWVVLIVYLGPFFLEMAKANIDVAIRIITGNINPGIVKIPTNLKTDLGITMLSNSITLTPGTLTVDVDEKTRELYVHWLDVKVKEPETSESVSGSLEKWIRRVTE